MISGKLRAFTIMELTVAMMITAIALAIMFTGYLIVNRSYRGFEKKHRQLANLELLSHWMQNDISQASSVSVDSGNLLTLAGGKQLIRYRFQASGIIRAAARTDTFKFPTDSIRFNFEGNPVAVSANDTTINITDDILFLLKADSVKIPFRFHKQYSSAELINLIPHAGN